MTAEEIIAKLVGARRLLREVRAGTDIPQIQSILGHANHNFHWGLWSVGCVETLHPEVNAD